MIRFGSSEHSTFPRYTQDSSAYGMQANQAEQAATLTCSHVPVAHKDMPGKQTESHRPNSAGVASRKSHPSQIWSFLWETRHLDHQYYDNPEATSNPKMQ